MDCYTTMTEIEQIECSHACDGGMNYEITYNFVMEYEPYIVTTIIY